MQTLLNGGQGAYIRDGGSEYDKHGLSDDLMSSRHLFTSPGSSHLKCFFEKFKTCGTYSEVPSYICNIVVVI